MAQAPTSSTAATTSTSSPFFKPSAVVVHLLPSGGDSNTANDAAPAETDAAAAADVVKGVAMLDGDLCGFGSVVVGAAVLPSLTPSSNRRSASGGFHPYHRPQRAGGASAATMITTASPTTIMIFREPAAAIDGEWMTTSTATYDDDGHYEDLTRRPRPLLLRRANPIQDVGGSSEFDDDVDSRGGASRGAARSRRRSRDELEQDEGLHHYEDDDHSSSSSSSQRRRRIHSASMRLNTNEEEGVDSLPFVSLENVLEGGTGKRPTSTVSNAPTALLLPRRLARDDFADGQGANVVVRLQPRHDDVDIGGRDENENVMGVEPGTVIDYSHYFQVGMLCDSNRRSDDTDYDNDNESLWSGPSDEIRLLQHPQGEVDFDFQALRNGGAADASVDETTSDDHDDFSLSSEEASSILLDAAELVVGAGGDADQVDSFWDMGVVLSS